MQSGEITVMPAPSANNGGAGGSLASGALANPIAVIKGVFLFAVIILVVFILWKFIKGINAVSNKIAELGPMSEAEKREIVMSPDYEAGLKWLDDRIGIETIVRKGRFKKVSDYLVKKNITSSIIAKAAESIYGAINGGADDEAAVYTAIASLPSKAAVSLMAQAFNTVYKKYTNAALSTFLSEDLDLTEMQTITNLINKKPEL